MLLTCTMAPKRKGGAAAGAQGGKRQVQGTGIACVRQETRVAGRRRGGMRDEELSGEEGSEDDDDRAPDAASESEDEDEAQILEVST